MNMNKQNVATVEDCKRLYDNDIVIQNTDCVWSDIICNWRLYRRMLCGEKMDLNSRTIPAPTLGEMWSELKYIFSYNGLVYYIQEMDEYNNSGVDLAELVMEVCTDLHKTVDLMIWCKNNGKFRR